MKEIKTVFDWEDEFENIEDVYANIYINDELKEKNVLFNSIGVKRNNAENIIVDLEGNYDFFGKVIIKLSKIYDLKIKLEFCEYNIPRTYREINILGGTCINQSYDFNNNIKKTTFKAKKIEYTSNEEIEILKEWYGCCNMLNIENGIDTSKRFEENIIYKNNNKKSFKLHRIMEQRSNNAFFIKLKDFKFKVSINDTKNTDEIYNKYTIEYRKSWGLIPNENIRKDISKFLSFIIGTELVKFGESGFNKIYIIKKQHIAISQMNKCQLYQRNEEFYNSDYRRNDTDLVIKQIPKMLNKYLKIKDEYRLNEVFASLYIHSYLNFNFINYVTYIEMFTNINLEKKKIKTVISKGKFKEVVKKLNSVKGVPKKIKNKFNELNTIGIGRKARMLLAKYKINYDEYSEVFSVRGKVVHGSEVDIKEMYMASQKAKELLTILTLKKLSYNGYIRNFTNDDELILIKDLSRHRVIENNNDIDFLI